MTAREHGIQLRRDEDARRKASVARDVPSRCFTCGGPLPPGRPSTAHEGRRTFCSKRCRQVAVKAERDEHNGTPPVRLSTGTTGAVSELVASADLLRRGYEVFRALSPSCFCDLLAFRDGMSLRIEVRTGTVNPTGKITFAFHERDLGRNDFFAIVIHGGTVIYLPPIDGEPMPSQFSERVLSALGCGPGSIYDDGTHVTPECDS